MEASQDQIGEALESLKNLTPEALDDLKKTFLGKGDQFAKKIKDEISKEMKRKGVNQKEIKEKFTEVKKELAALSKVETKKAILITSSRQMKTKNVPKDFSEDSAKSILNCTTVVGMSCTRLSVGNLSGKTIKVWYDPNVLSKNKRATKIVGFLVGGSLLITCDEEDLTEEDLLPIEQSL